MSEEAYEVEETEGLRILHTVTNEYSMFLGSEGRYARFKIVNEYDGPYRLSVLVPGGDYQFLEEFNSRERAHTWLEINGKHYASLYNMADMASTELAATVRRILGQRILGQ